MSHGIWNFALASVHDGDALTVSAHECARVTGLPTAERIEDRAVELDAAVGHGEHSGFGAGEIGVVAEEEGGGHGRILAGWRRSRARLVATATQESVDDRSADLHRPEFLKSLVL